MSVTEQVSKRNESSSPYANFDEYIDFQLKKTRSGIHQADLLTGVILFAVGVVAYLLLFALFDQWILAEGFSPTMRMLLTGTAVLCGGVWLCVKVLLPSLKTVNSLYAARQIERHHPEFHSGLMTWVDFRQTGRPLPAQVLTSLEKRTATQINKTNIEEAIDRRLLMRASYLLLGLVVLFCLYTLFSPKRMSTTLWRALMPFSAVSAATRTEIRDVKPGNTEVLARTQVDVQVELGGTIPEDVTLFFSTADRRFLNEPLKMRRLDPQQPVFSTRLAGDGGKGLLSDVTYHVIAGDAKSQKYEIRINQPPTAEVTEIEYDYPQYMGLPRSIQKSNAIDSWEGVWVTVVAKPNMPVKRAVLYCSDQETIQETAEAYPLQIQDDRLSARWQLKFRDDGTFARYFHLQVWNERNQQDPQPTVYRLKVRPDLKPELTLIHPDRDQSVPVNAVVPVAIGARDPDFLLRRVTLRLERNGEEFPVPALFSAPPEMAEFRTIHPLDLSKLNLKPGDTLTLFAEAEDNFEPFGTRQKNLSRTPRITLTIAPPVSEQEKKQMEEQQTEEARQKIPPADDAERPSQQAPEQQPKPAQQPRQQDPAQQKSPQQQNSQEKDGSGGGEGTPSGQDSAGDQKQEPGQNGMPSKGSSSQGESGQQQSGKGSSQQASPNGESNGESAGDSKQGSDGMPGEQGMSNGESGDSTSKGNPQNSGGRNSTQQDPNGSKSNGASSGSSAGGSGPSDSSKSRDDKLGEDQALQKLLDWDREQQKKNPGSSSQENPGDGNSDGGNSSEQKSPSQPKPGESSSAEKGEGMNSKGASGEADSGSGKNSAAGQNQTPENGSGKPMDRTAPAEQPGKSSSSTGASESRPSDAAGQPQQNGEKSKGNETPQNGGQPQDSGKPQNGEMPENSKSGGSPDAADGSSQGTKPQNRNAPDANPQGTNPQGDEPRGMNAPQQGADSASGEGAPQGTPKGNGEQGSGSPMSQGPMNSAGKNETPGSSGGTSPEKSPGTPSDATMPKNGMNGEQPTGGGNGEQSTADSNGQKPMQGDSGQPSPEGTSKSGSGQPDDKHGPLSKPGRENDQGKTPDSGMKSPQGETSSGSDPSGQPMSSEGKSSPSGESSSQGNPKGGDPKTGDQGKTPFDGSSPGTPGGQSQPGTSPAGKDGMPSDGSPQSGKSNDGTASEGSASSPMGERGPQSTGKGSNQADSADTSTGALREDLLTPEQADLANRKKATELALKRLKEQLERGQVPDSLMQELGYSEEDLGKFMNRLDERLADPGTDQSAESEAARRQFDSLLKGLSTGQSKQHRSGGERERKATQSTGSGSRPVPPEYRPGSDAYKQKLTK